MEKLGGIQGGLLEEAVAFLLETSAYLTLPLTPTDPRVKDDPTLAYKRGSLYVKGRGASHQIDTIADYFFSPRFSHPLRLLVEAKYHGHSNKRGNSGEPTGLEVIRNAIGVLKDVSEFVPNSSSKATSSGITPAARLIPRARYHYQAAVVSTTRFTPEAER